MKSGTAAAALLLARVLLGAAAAGCSPLLPAVTPVPADAGVEHLPAPAYLHLAGDPAAAPRMLTITYVLSDGSVPPQADIVKAGDTVDVSRTFQPGTHAVTVNGRQCDGPFDLAGDVVTDVVMHLVGERCSTTVDGTRPGAVDVAPPS